MRRVVSFLRQYKLFSLAIIALIVSLVLQLTHHAPIAHWVLGIAATLAVFPLLWDMWQDVRVGTYGIDILAATAIITSVILGQYWAAIVIVLMLTGGEALEDYAHRRAQSELKSLLNNAPQKATVYKKNKLVEVKASELHIGDRILVRPGELVPADAIILEGAASFDESSLTGESIPQPRDVGAQLLSGSLNIDGAITAKVTAAAEDSQYQQIVRLVRGAAASQAPFVRLADRYALPFTVTAFAIATAAWVVSGSSLRFLEVLVVATPCPLILAAPIALISGMSRASRFGIIVKTGGALERLAEAETIAFDKTGTLTRGELAVENVTAFGSYTPEQILAIAAGLEQQSNHVVARSVVQAAADKGIKPVKTKHVKEIAGRGVEAMQSGKDVVVGRFTLMTDREVRLPTRFDRKKIQQTAVYISVNDELVGMITFLDEIRPEAKQTIEQLKSFGVRNMLMITGDNESTAQAIARELGITKVYAETLPADKLRLMEAVKERPLAFVGDGVNDAPVLTGADIGIALGARGSAAASESADMVIMLDDVSRVAIAMAIARRTFRIARQSIMIGIAMSIGLMLVFSTGKFTALTGALVQEAVDVFVIFNALRAHSGKH
jgi:heavy metal translocating P-type ATPase